MAAGHIDPRKNKDGSISYQLVVEVERDPLTGKRRRYYKTVRGTKKEANAALRKLITDCESGGVAAPSAMKIEDWMAQWLSLYLPNIEPTTRDSYEEKIRNYIIPGLGKIQLKSLKTENIQRWVNDLSTRGLSPKTIRNAYNNLNAALKKACVLRMIPYNPCDGVELPKLEHYEAKIYDADDINIALEKAKGTDMYLIIFLLAMVGLRRGELLGLKWEKIDLEKRKLYVLESRVLAKGETVTKSPKTKAGIRTITLGAEVVAELKTAKMEYFKDRTELGAAFHDHGYVIRKKNGDPYRPDSITQKWERFLEKNNLPKIRLHDLRHSNATMLAAAKVNQVTIQKRLGHSDITTTMRYYTHMLPAMDADAADTLDEMILKKA